MTAADDWFQTYFDTAWATDTGRVQIVLCAILSLIILAGLGFCLVLMISCCLTKYEAFASGLESRSACYVMFKCVTKTFTMFACAPFEMCSLGYTRLIKQKADRRMAREKISKAHAAAGTNTSVDYCACSAFDMGSMESGTAHKAGPRGRPYG